MNKRFIKVLYVGLSNAGKTSIILSLEKDYSRLGKLTPTLGIERSKMDLMGTETIFWDFGGQEKFIEKYLKDNISFLDSDLIFYILDIKDPEQYDKSFQYFENILKILNEYNENPEIIVCIHKFDPDIQNNPEYQEKFEILKERFRKIAKKDIHVFKTSIYNKKSLIEAFSYGISKLLTDFAKIDIILSNFLEEQNLEGILFFEKNSLILSEVYRNDSNKDFYLTIIMDLFTTIEKLKNIRRINELSIVINNQIQFLMKNVAIDNTNFFLVLIGSNFINIKDIWKIFLKEKFPKIEKIIINIKKG